jgi:hypothetical protein
MSQFDLHSHTTHSDGTLTPADLVRRAKNAGVDVLAVTDHDVTSGLAEALAEAERVGLRLLPGVEISVTWEGTTIHVVGLGVEADSAGLQAGLARLREFRAWRAGEIGRRLECAGIDGAGEGARTRAKGLLISRTHFGRFLVDAGHARDMGDAFKRWLGNGRPGYVPGQWAGLSEAVGWIRAAQGHAVIAHPARYKLGTGRLRRLFGDFRECGGEAIEVVSGSHSRDDYHRFAQFAREFDFHASCGSDFHGPETPWIELGRLPSLPDGCKPVWRLWE